jgi:putative transposase
MIERFFRSLKEECIWLHNFRSLKEAKAIINEWIHFYNEERPHQALDYRSPVELAPQQLQKVA